MQLVTPTVLTSIIVTALSEDAYTQACDDSSALEDILYKPGSILRQGEVLSLPSLQATTSYNANPLQYRLEMIEPVLQGFAKRDETKIILLSSADNIPVMDNAEEEDVFEEQEYFEIDEDFLGSSVLSVSGPSALDKNQDTFSNQSNHSHDNSSSGFSSKPLNYASGLHEDDCTLFLRAPDLGKLGILSGDWVRVVKTQYTIHQQISRQ